MTDQDKNQAHNDLEREAVRSARLASNASIAQQDIEGVARFWVEDIVVISGEGGKYTGKKNLVKVWKQMFDQGTPLFERIPSEIKIGQSGTLAWEAGQWGYLDGTPGGNYAAMWRKVGNKWMTRSELFVALD